MTDLLRRVLLSQWPTLELPSLGQYGNNHDNMRDYNTSSCLGLEFLESQSSAGPRLILTTSTIMFMIFLTSMLYILTLVARMTFTSWTRSSLRQRQRSHSSSTPFYPVTYAFYIFIMLFCLNRSLYYATVIFDGIADLSHYVHPEIMEFVQTLFYHGASTWFYCGFLIINFKWVGWWIYSNGLGPWSTYRLIRTPRRIVSVATVAIVVMQMVILSALFIVLVLDISDSLSHVGLRVLFVLQLVYHSFLGLMAVLSFGFWIAYARAKKEITRGMSNRQSMKPRLYMLFAVTSLLTVLILFKSLANLGLAVMRSFADFCKNTNVAVVSVFGIIVDILPVIVVVYVLSSSFSADEEDYEEDDVTGGDNGQLSISKMASSETENLLVNHGYQSDNIVHQNTMPEPTEVSDDDSY